MLPASNFICPVGQDGFITSQLCDLRQVTALLCASVSSSVKSSSYQCLQWAVVRLSARHTGRPENLPLSLLLLPASGADTAPAPSEAGW